MSLQLSSTSAYTVPPSRSSLGSWLALVGFVVIVAQLIVFANVAHSHQREAQARLDALGMGKPAAVVHVARVGDDDVADYRLK